MEAIGFPDDGPHELPEGLLEQARLMESYGADTVYFADSAGALTTNGVRARVAEIVGGIDVRSACTRTRTSPWRWRTRSLRTRRARATSTAPAPGLGAVPATAPTEILAAVCEKNGIVSGVDPLKLMDLAEGTSPGRSCPPAGHRPGEASSSGTPASTGRSSCTPGRPPRYGVSQAEILLELGRRKVVGAGRT